MDQVSVVSALDDLEMFHEVFELMDKKEIIRIARSLPIFKDWILRCCEVDIDSPCDLFGEWQ